MKTTGPLAATLALLIAAPAMAAERKMELKDLPEAVRKTVLEQSRGGKIRGLAHEIDKDNKPYEAEITLASGKKKDVLIDASGRVIEVEEQIAIADLPPAVKAQLERSAGKGKIGVIEALTQEGVLTAYEAEVTEAGRTTDIKIAPAGTLIASPIPQTGKATITPKQAEDAALRVAPGGKAGNVTLGEKNGRPIYTVEVRAHAKPVREVKVDAVTGRIVRVETTDRHKLDDEKDDELNERQADEREEKD